MTRDRFSESPDDGELLAAYLAGELSDDEQAGVAARLAREPRLARRLDDLAELLVRLRRIDDVSVPHGYAERLRDRLEGERAAARMPVAATPPTEDEASEPDEPVAAVSRTTRRGVAELPSRLLPVLAAAAALVAVAVLGAAAVTGLGPFSSEVGSGEEAAGGGPGGGAGRDAALSGQAESASTPLGSRERAEAAAPQAASELTAPSDAIPPTLPLLSDRRDAREAKLGRLEAAAQQVLDSQADPRVRAAALTQAVADAPAFPGGPAPGACLEEVVAEEPGPVVPVAVRALTVNDRTRLAYAVAQPAERGGPLTTARVIVADAQTCRFLTADELSAP